MLQGFRHFQVERLNQVLHSILHQHQQDNNQVQIDLLFTGFDEKSCEKIRNFLENDKKECEGCDIRYRCCAHECACTSFYTTGSIEGVSPEVCTHERMLAEICDTLMESSVTTL